MRPIIFTLSLLTLFTFSCINNDDDGMNISVEEECLELATLDTLLLLETSKAFIPIEESASKIIFSDADGNEYTGNINYNINSISTTSQSSATPCPVDNSIDIFLRWHGESKSIEFEIEELDVRLLARLRATYQTNNYPDLTYYDIANVVLQTPIESTQPNAQIVVLVNPRNHPDTQGGNLAEKIETLMLHGKEFNDVYLNSPSDEDEFKIYYNEEVGFVGFERAIDSLSLKFERIE